MDLLIRNLNPSIIKLLKRRAKLHHQSLQDALKFIFEASTKISSREAKKISHSWKRKLSRGNHSDSAELLRKHRNCSDFL